MKKKRVSALSALPALILSIIAIAVAVVPNYVTSSNETYNNILGNFNYLKQFVTNDICNLSFSGLFSGDQLYITITAIGLVFLLITIIVLLISMIAKKKLGRYIFAGIAFVASLGIFAGIIVDVINGADFVGLVKDTAAGYFIFVGATFLTFVFSFFGKKK